jgi:CheY-like chemotaxis protein
MRHARREPWSLRLAGTFLAPTLSIPKFACANQEPLMQTPSDTDLRSIVVNGTRPSRVLLTEPDEQLRRLVANALRRDGYTVLEIDSGPSLIERVRTCPGDVDLIVSATQLPGFIGLELLRLLRSWDPTTPVIVLIPAPDSETEGRALRQGAQGILAKPFDTAELRFTTQSLCPPVVQTQRLTTFVTPIWGEPSELDV